MADDFLKALEQDSRARFAAESFEVETSQYAKTAPDDVSIPEETWRIQPLPAGARDKVIQCIQTGEYYKGLATSLVYRAYKTEGSGRRFRPSDVEGLMKNPDFLDWVAEEINFQGDFDWLLDLEATEEKKPSKPADGSGR